MEPPGQSRPVRGVHLEKCRGCPSVRRGSTKGSLILVYAWTGFVFFRTFFSTEPLHITLLRHKFGWQAENRRNEGGAGIRDAGFWIMNKNRLQYGAIFYARACVRNPRPLNPRARAWVQLPDPRWRVRSCLNGSWLERVWNTLYVSELLEIIVLFLLRFELRECSLAHKGICVLACRYNSVENSSRLKQHSYIIPS